MSADSDHPRRREFLATFTALLALPRMNLEAATQAPTPVSDAPSLRVRTLTAGVALRTLADLGPVDTALAALGRSKRRFEESGYEVQTIRIATPALLAQMAAPERAAALPLLVRLDSLVADRGAILSIGPVFTGARGTDPALVPWSVKLVQATRVTSFSIAVASADRGVHRDAVVLAGQVIAALAQSAPGGVANFRFAAAARVPAGTPFFPVAWHHGPEALAVGVESPRIVRAALGGASGDPDVAEERVRHALDSALTPIAKLAAACAQAERRKYLGIDPSPAPGLDSSIGEAIEALTATPFGGASTLGACAAITAALKSLRVATCGYAGLMLPVLEDPVLARRAAEGRFGLRDLLLFSSVCGTGLDVVPLPGDASPESLARVITDVATLATRLQKPLSARLFPIPGKAAGDTVHFDDPFLTGSVVMRLD